MALGRVAEAQILRTPLPTTTLQQTVAPACTSESKVEVVSLYVLPSNSAAQEGQSCEVYLTIKNVCNGTLNIPWRIERAIGGTLATGTQMNVLAGQSSEVRVVWTAIAGRHTFIGRGDPNNTLGDTGPNSYARHFKTLDYTVPVTGNWAEWGTSAATGARAGIRAAIAGATVKGTVNGPLGGIPRGGLDGGGGYIMGPLYSAMGTAVPTEIKAAFHGALKEAWDQWASNYEVVVGAITFPAFAVFPGPLAPETPGTPPSFPMAVGSSSGEGYLSAGNLATAVRNRLAWKYYATQPGADAAVNAFAQSVADRFSAWKLGGGSVCSIKGWGPVPLYNPPNVYAAPVVNGTIAAKLCGDF